jgi:hypothetical protein
MDPNFLAGIGEVPFQNYTIPILPFTIEDITTYL